MHDSDPDVEKASRDPIGYARRVLLREVDRAKELDVKLEEMRYGLIMLYLMLGQVVSAGAPFPDVMGWAEDLLNDLFDGRDVCELPEYAEAFVDHRRMLGEHVAETSTAPLRSRPRAGQAATRHEQ
jgi:hypothetical protein